MIMTTTMIMTSSLEMQSIVMKSFIDTRLVIALFMVLVGKHCNGNFEISPKSWSYIVIYVICIHIHKLAYTMVKVWGQRRKRKKRHEMCLIGILDFVIEKTKYWREGGVERRGREERRRENPKGVE